ncbi:hypothetical protein C8Q73DRAFT_822877 [Cubamyces lactineus]|nr:hypothetical protein C8Q73DRAFT_822877 [Cubamyces lactineus]
MFPGVIFVVHNFFFTHAHPPHAMTSSDSDWSSLSLSSLSDEFDEFVDADEGYSYLVSHCSKREYLLAQIRQKNAIIESLLKQIHNPYLATPMSIASYRMATPPTDQNNQNVIVFLDRLQASVQTADTNTGANAFKMDTRADDRRDDSDDSGDERGANELTERESTAPLKDAEDKPHALPDQTVPIGLLAKMALDNKRKPRKSGAKLKENESSDDDIGVANETFFEPGPAYILGLRAMMIESVSPPEILVHAS